MMIGLDLRLRSAGHPVFGVSPRPGRAHGRRRLPAPVYEEATSRPGEESVVTALLADVVRDGLGRLTRAVDGWGQHPSTADQFRDRLEECELLGQSLAPLWERGGGSLGEGADAGALAAALEEITEGAAGFLGLSDALRQHAAGGTPPSRGVEKRLTRLSELYPRVQSVRADAGALLLRLPPPGLAPALL